MGVPRATEAQLVAEHKMNISCNSNNFDDDLLNFAE